MHSGSVLLDSQYLPGDDSWRVGECGTVSTETKSERSQSSEDGKTFTTFDLFHGLMVDGLSYMYFLPDINSLWHTRSTFVFIGLCILLCMRYLFSEI